MFELRHVQVTRYAQPLREGGSMPGLVEGDDGFYYVMKFRSAGQGRKALIAELLGGEIARRLGAKMPELVYLELPEGLGRTEADEEIQDLLQGSVGLNIGLSFLSKAMTFDPTVSSLSSIDQSRLLWLDAYILNVDRTIRNPNLLIWYREPWLIDHGAAFFFHHQWENWERYITSKFPQGKEHVVFQSNWDRTAIQARVQDELTDDWLVQLVQEIPEDWLEDPVDDLDPEEKRRRYLTFLMERRNFLLANPHDIYPI
ncbi:MAG: HipA family kinase [Spirosomataceae bacterium]